MHISKRSSFFAVLFVMALAFGCGGGGGGDGDGGGAGGGMNPGGGGGNGDSMLTLQSETSCPAPALNADAPRRPSVFVQGTRTCGVISASSQCMGNVITNQTISIYLGNLGTTFSFILCQDTSDSNRLSGFIRSGDGNTIYSWIDIDGDTEIDLNEALLPGLLGSDMCAGTGNKAITLDNNNPGTLQFNRVCVLDDTDSNGANQSEYEFNGMCQETPLEDIEDLLTPSGQETLRDLIEVLNGCST